jgi:hypothetical protein
LKAKCLNDGCKTWGSSPSVDACRNVKGHNASAQDPHIIWAPYLHPNHRAGSFPPFLVSLTYRALSSLLHSFSESHSFSGSKNLVLRRPSSTAFTAASASLLTPPPCLIGTPSTTTTSKSLIQDPGRQYEEVDIIMEGLTRRRTQALLQPLYSKVRFSLVRKRFRYSILGGRPYRDWYQGLDVSTNWRLESNLWIPH